MLYRSYAKINLYLDVLGKREDGFHRIETIFQTVSLYDTLRIEGAESEVTLSIEGADLPEDEGNLVMRAAGMLRERYDVSDGAKLTLEKSIPIAAGLAGGSGDAAAALVGLNSFWEIGASVEELQEIGGALGSDIPYCLLGGTMAGTGRGEVLAGLDSLPETWFLLAHPPVEVRTSAMYGHPDLVKSGAEVSEHGHSEGLDRAIRGCKSGDFEGILYNAMESAALGAYPVIEEYKERLREAGCEGVLMSGSGPTVFGLCRDEGHALSVQAPLGDIRTTVVHTVDLGVARFDA